MKDGIPLSDFLVKAISTIIEHGGVLIVYKEKGNDHAIHTAMAFDDEEFTFLLYQMAKSGVVWPENPEDIKKKLVVKADV